jgi:hypothetical protein
VIRGEPGRQQLHHGFRDHELQVLGSRETRIARLGFRETSRWSEAWDARSDSRMPVPCDISSTSLVPPPQVGNLVLAHRGSGTLEVSRSPRKKTSQGTTERMVRHNMGS